MHEADHLPPTSAEVKKEWSYTSTPKYVFKAWWLIKQEIHLHDMVLSFKQGDNFTFTFNFMVVLEMNCTKDGKKVKLSLYFN
jgi:hypothetical protein